MIAKDEVTMVPLVSIIIPVYNVEKYLEECIDSVRKQSLRDIEIILMDDGSTDSSPIICDKYAKMDERIVVVHQKNQGLCKTRNIAMAYTKAPWLTFVDSDDWLSENACEIMYSAAIEANADFIFGNYVKVVGENRKEKKPYPEKEIRFTGNDIKERLLKDIIAPTADRLRHPELIDSLLTCAAKLYKKEIIVNNSLEWIDRRVIYSDCLDFIAKYAACCHSALYISEPLYYYRRDNAASQTAQYRKNIDRLWNYQFESLESFIKEKNLGNLYEACRNRICFSIIPIGGNAIALPTLKEQREECKALFDSERYKAAFESFPINQLPISYRPLFWTAKNNHINIFLLLTRFMRMAMKFVC